MLQIALSTLRKGLFGSQPYKLLPVCCAFLTWCFHPIHLADGVAALHPLLTYPAWAYAIYFMTWTNVTCLRVSYLNWKLANGTGYAALLLTQEMITPKAHRLILAAIAKGKTEAIGQAVFTGISCALVVAALWPLSPDVQAAFVASWLPAPFVFFTINCGGNLTMGLMCHVVADRVRQLAALVERARSRDEFNALMASIHAVHADLEHLVQCLQEPICIASSGLGTLSIIFVMLGISPQPPADHAWSRYAPPVVWFSLGTMLALNTVAVLYTPASVTAECDQLVDTLNGGAGVNERKNTLADDNSDRRIGRYIER